MASFFEKAVEEAKRADQEERAKRSRGRQGEANGVTVGDLSGIFRVLSFASVEPATMERNKIIPAVGDKGAVASYKVLRTRVLQRMRANNWRHLIVTGAGPGEGKTLTACNLAVSIARDVNQSVFLVDLDLQRPSVAEYFGLDADAGIGDYLTGKATIEDIIYAPTDLDRIVIIPNREPVENSSELLASPRMKDLQTWLKRQGGAPLAIFDMPPVLGCDDVLAFYPLADALLMVTSERITERDSLARALEMMGDHNLLGVVLNYSREHSKSSAYY